MCCALQVKINIPISHWCLKSQGIKLEGWKNAVVGQLSMDFKHPIQRSRAPRPWNSGKASEKCNFSCHMKLSWTSFFSSSSFWMIFGFIKSLASLMRVPSLLKWNASTTVCIQVCSFSGVLLVVKLVFCQVIKKSKIKIEDQERKR